MATQFDRIMDRFEDMETRIDNLSNLILGVMEAVGASPMEVDFSEEYQAEMRNQSGEDYEPGRHRRRAMNRREIEVRAFGGGTKMVKWENLDSQLVKAIEISERDRLDYELYEDPNGTVRIAVDAEVAHQIRKAMTYQQPVPRTVEIPEDMDVDEAAKPKEE